MTLFPLLFVGGLQIVLFGFLGSQLVHLRREVYRLRRKVVGTCSPGGTNVLRLAIVTNRYPRDPDDLASPFVHHFCDALSACGVQLAVLAPEVPGEGRETDPWVRRFHWTRDARVFGDLSLYNPADWIRLAARDSCGAGRPRAGFSKRLSPTSRWLCGRLPSGYWLSQFARTHQLPYAVWCLGSDVQALGPAARGEGAGDARAWRSGQRVRRRLRARRRSRPCLRGGLAAFSPPRDPCARAVTASDPQEPVRPYVLYFGRLSRDKGVDTLLDAARLLPPAFPSRFVLCGPAAPGFDPHAEIASRSLADRCTCLPPQSPALLAELVRGAGHGGDSVAAGQRSRSSWAKRSRWARRCCARICPTCAPCSRVITWAECFPRVTRPPWRAALLEFRPPAHFTTEAARFLSDFSPAHAARTFLADVERLLGGRHPTPQTRESVHA